jgi:hypothetical protein
MSITRRPQRARRVAYAGDASVRMRRAGDRQIEHARQSYVVDTTLSPREEFEILAAAQRG